jgi:hypothetical protein
MIYVMLAFVKPAAEIRISIGLAPIGPAALSGEVGTKTGPGRLREHRGYAKARRHVPGFYIEYAPLALWLNKTPR